jgi:DNA polymerase-3 subunit delta
MPLFGGRRVVWLRDVTFLADSVTGRSETTLNRVEELQRILSSVNPEETSVLVTAAPVDRRRSFVKWCEKTAAFTLADGGDPEAAAAVALAEAKALGVSFGEGALELLQVRAGSNTRFLAEEVRKLASGSAGNEITRELVAELTPNVADSDFFETAEAFTAGRLDWALEAIKRHFFGGGEARALLAALQNRNRLMIQLRALTDAGEARAGRGGIEGLDRARQSRIAPYGEAASEKSSFNIFTQNAWYLGKMAGAGTLPSLRKLIDNQRSYVDAFEEVLRRPADDQEDIMRDLAVRCLAP